jgi:hypothetical protein
MEGKVEDRRWMRVVQQGTHDGECVHMCGRMDIEGLQSRDVYEREIYSLSISTGALEKGIPY